MSRSSRGRHRHSRSPQQPPQAQSQQSQQQPQPQSEPSPPAYPSPPAPQQPPALPGEQHRSVMVVGRIALALLAAIALVASGVGWAFNVSGTSDALADAGNVGVVVGTGAAAPSGGDQGAAVTDTAPAPTDSPAMVPSVPRSGDLNVLLVGSDSRSDAQGNPLTPQQQAEVGVTLDGGSVNTDTLLVVHIPADDTAATVVSIPRDTWMDLDVMHAPGVTGPDEQGNQVQYRATKINGVYSTAKYYQSIYLKSQGMTGPELERRSNEAGRTMLIKVVQQFTGIKIDHFAEVNLLGFYLISKAIGGVPVCLVNPVNDHRSRANFPAGYQTVEGADALAFVRQRHGVPGGDLGRIKRTQAFLGSALNKILSVGTLTNPSRLNGLIDAVHQSIVLDSGFDLITFAEEMRGLMAGDVTFATVPTHPATNITSTAALAADPLQVRALFAALDAGQPLPTVSPSTPGLPSSTDTTTPQASSTESSGPSATESAADQSGRYQVPCVY